MPVPRSLHPPPKMVAGGRQCAPGSTITPTKTCCVFVYRRIKRRLGRSLKRLHHKGNLVPFGKQATHKLPGTKGGLSVENPDLVYQQAGYSQTPTYSRPAECGRRQAIQDRPDNSNRVVPPSRGLPGNMQQVAPTSDRPLCNKVQQQTSHICVTSVRPPGLGSQCTQPAMGGSGPIYLPTSSHLGGSGPICLPTSSHLAQSGGEVAGLPVQENHSDLSGVAQHGQVLTSNGHVQPNPN